MVKDGAIAVSALLAIPSKIWILLLVGPLLFLLAIVVTSLFFTFKRVHQADISARVVALLPHILLVVLSCLALFTVGFANEVVEAWRLPAFGKGVSDLVVGLVAGSLLAMAYIYWLAPLLEMLQRTVGDYVPPGAILPAISSSVGLFFIANVLLAPLVEETVYRGIALPLLGVHVGVFWAAVLSCLLFGLLHWAGGFWYVLLTGIVAGGLFAGLFYWREGLLAPFAAHFALNLIEFIYVWRVFGRAS